MGCSQVNDAGAHPHCAPWTQVDLWFSFIGLLEALVWLLVFVKLDRDKRGFAARAISRILLLCCLPLVWLPTLLFYLHDVNAIGQAAVYFLLEPIVLYLTIAGPGQASHIPVVGPLVVRWLLAGCFA